jgi:hypothetical protein
MGGGVGVFGIQRERSEPRTALVRSSARAQRACSLYLRALEQRKLYGPSTDYILVLPFYGLKQLSESSMIPKVQNGPVGLRRGPFAAPYGPSTEAPQKTYGPSPAPLRLYTTPHFVKRKLSPFKRFCKTEVKSL